MRTKLEKSFLRDSSLRCKLTLAVVGAAFILAGCGSSTQSQLSENRSSNRAQALAAAVDMPDASSYEARDLRWTDALRPDGPREVLARFYLPVAVKGSENEAVIPPVPLVVFSHGIGGSREGYSYIGKHLAANGIAALHVQHVGSDRSLWFGNPLQMVTRLQEAAKDKEAIARTQDVSFVLNQVLASPEFKSRVDATRISAAGHSYGANTVLLLVGARVLRDSQVLDLADPRIRSAVIISAPPFYGQGDPQSILGGIAVPSLHITAQGDEINIPGYYSAAKDRVAIFEATASTQSSVAKTLAVFSGGSHSIFTDRLGTGGETLNPLVKKATRDLILAFLRQEFFADDRAITEWPAQHQAVVSRFEQSQKKERQTAIKASARPAAEFLTFSASPQ
jgi:dienelactone hydrolase